MLDREREEMILDNVGLAISMAKKYSHYEGRLDDLIQAGYEGLIKAVDRFDPDKGFKFSTYATFWIRAALQDEQKRDANPSVSHLFLKNAYKVGVTRNVLLGKQIPETPENVAEESGIDLDTVEAAMRYETPKSLDYEPPDPDHHISVHEMVGGKEDDYSGVELRSMLDRLPTPLARAITYPLYGIMGDEAGEMEGITRAGMEKRRRRAEGLLQGMT